MADNDVTVELGEAESEQTASTAVRLDALAAAVRARLATNLDSQLQLALAELLQILPAVARADDARLVDVYEGANKALLAEQPNYEAAAALLTELRTLLKAHNGMFGEIVSARSPSLVISFGLALFLFLFSVAALLVHQQIDDDVLKAAETLLQEPPLLLTMVALAGLMGSTVSIMVRIGSFEAQNRDFWPLFFTGFFKPFVGLASALMLFALMKSDILPLKVPDGPEQHYFALALAFMAGFSERLVGDAVAAMESRLGQEAEKPA